MTTPTTVRINVFRIFMFVACLIAFVAFGVVVFSKTLPVNFKAEALFLVLGFAFAGFVFHD